MTSTTPSTTLSLQIQDMWNAPTFEGMTTLPDVLSSETRFRLFHIAEIGQGKAAAYRLAMANVISSMNDPKCKAVYLLSGTPEGVKLYIGVASSAIPEDELHETAKTLCASFEGNFLGSKLTDIKKEGNAGIRTMLKSAKHLGLITGVPSYNEDEKNAGDEDFQGIERLANSLIGETWQLVVVAQACDPADIQNTLDDIYEFSTWLSSHQKQSVQRSENTGWSKTATTGTSTSDTYGTNTSDTHGTNKSDTRGKNEGGSTDTGKNSGTSSGSSTTRTESTSSGQSKSFGTNESLTKGTSTSKTTGTSDSKTKGTSDSMALGTTGGKGLSYTNERVDKRIEEIQKHISENLIPRFQQGRSKGMFRTAMYVLAQNQATYDRLTRSVLSIFQGNEATMTPLRMDKLPTPTKDPIFHIGHYALPDHDTRRELIYSIPFNAQSEEVWGATWLNTNELSLIAGLPAKELPGLKIRKSVDFALNTADIKPDVRTLALGRIIQHGRELPHKQVQLPLADLAKHVFVTGVTGSGKTTTCMKLLLESDLPFMVIEPAKTEYRALHSKNKDIEYYILGREDLTPFRLNPFELVSDKENLAGHISTISATLSAVFPMEAAMPYLVEEAIIKAYKTKGWDIHSGNNFLVDAPWALGSGAWPTFADMIAELDGVIQSKKMGAEFTEKYRGSLVGRLTNLTLGVKGRMLNTRYSLDFDQLLDKKVVIELEELKDEQDKALFMGFIISRLAECMKHRHRRDPDFRHLTLVEEAHRLLSRPDPGEAGSKKLGVDMFANLLSEVRKYGEGLIIADQIPNKLVSDVIKNTHTKIVHRLFSADDRNTIGDAMGLSDEQKDFLPLLQTGETIIYCGGWHAPVWVKIDEQTRTDRPEIAEEDMAAKGRAQMWAQRTRMFPSLSECAEMVNGQVLSRFVTDGIMLLNMFLTINLEIDDPKNAERVQAIQPRYSKQFNAMASELGVALDVMGHRLTQLFFDCSGFYPTLKTKDLTLEVLPTAFVALGESLVIFQAFRSERKSRHVLQTDANFKKVVSI